MTARDLDRFRTLVKTGPDCWEWTGARFNTGYGRFQLNGDGLLAHRVMMALAWAGIPEGLIVCHHCDNPPCVRPSHLFLGNSRDNVMDAIAKGRHEGPSNKSLEIRGLLTAGMTQSQIARRIGISRQRVSQIAQNSPSRPLDE